MSRSAACLAPLLLLSACAPMGQVADFDEDCPDLVPLASRAAIEASPRPVEDAERLALSLGDGFVADEDVYQQVAADLAAIRAADPGIAHIPAGGYTEPHTFGISFGTSVGEAVAHGTYHAWDCLNERYGVELLWPDEHSAYLVTPRIYDLQALADAYASLPGIRDAETTGRIGDGPRICAVRTPNGIDYLFDDAGGDCPSGCTEHDYHLWTANDGAAPTHAASWTPPTDGQFYQYPDWFDPFTACLFPWKIQADQDHDS